MLAEFELVTVFRWVDDNLFVRRKGCKTDMNDIATRAIELGVLTNATKYKPFEDEQKFIGFFWNGVHKTVRLPNEKLAKRINQIKEFLVEGAMFSFNDIEIIVGRLNHVSYIVPQLRCYLCGLYMLSFHFSSLFFFFFLICCHSFHQSFYSICNCMSAPTSQPVVRSLYKHS